MTDVLIMNNGGVLRILIINTGGVDTLPWLLLSMTYGSTARMRTQEQGYYCRKDKEEDKKEEKGPNGDRVLLFFRCLPIGESC